MSSDSKASPLPGAPGRPSRQSPPPPGRDFDPDREGDPALSGSPEEHKAQVALLLFSILVIALCGITYELLIGTLSSYLLGNSVVQFSTTIGLFLSSMGLGSWLSQFVRRQLLRTFVLVEVAVGLVGGLAAPLLFSAFAFTPAYRLVMFTAIIVIGSLVGLEIPLLTRIVRSYAELRVAISKVLTWDYAGALVGSLIFPLVLLPRLGLIRASLVVGLLNLAVALVTFRVFRRELGRAPGLVATAAVAITTLLIGLASAKGITSFVERSLYQDPIIYETRSPYQRIVLTRWRDDIRLYIDGNIQFSSVDEYRYHEALVHPALALAGARSQVLILGGGDGLAAREVLKWPGVEKVTLVDLDPRMTALARELPPIVALNQGALNDRRVQVINDDAYRFLEGKSRQRGGETFQRYNVIIIDLPDPNNESLAKLYSREFYLLVAKNLARDGVVSVQSTSPFFSREAFYCIGETMRAAGLNVRPYHAYVPSFGDWGFHLAAQPPWRAPLDVDRLKIPVKARFLDEETTRSLFVFPLDSRVESPKKPVRVSTLASPSVLEYYLGSEARWNE